MSRTQTVHSINFSYQPPPRNVVPYAAALKGQGSRCAPQPCMLSCSPAKTHSSHGPAIVVSIPLLGQHLAHAVAAAAGLLLCCTPLTMFCLGA